MLAETANKQMGVIRRFLTVTNSNLICY